MIADTTIPNDDFLRRFPTEREARNYIEDCRWHGNPTCPKCGTASRIQTRKIESYYRCLACKGDFTVRTGTIFERSHVPLVKWLHAIYLWVNAQQAISSIRLSKNIGVTQKTAWFMLARLRRACSNGSDSFLLMIIESDGAFSSGEAKEQYANGRSVGLDKRDSKAMAIKACIENSTLPHTKAIETAWTILQREFCGTYYRFVRTHKRGSVDKFIVQLNKGDAKEMMRTIGALLGTGEAVPAMYLGSVAWR